ncbi:hypothetical protein [Viridibacterium curvum]|uniref:Lipoprotein n=1 Tax=Viridibacterium curvum TaxID=1101404 RepID=A0ABP9QRB2_9RHOO
MRAAILLLALLVCPGCALSVLQRQDSLKVALGERGTEPYVSVFKPHDPLTMSVAFGCDTRVVSAMVSLLVPLPPVIPGWLFNDKPGFFANVQLPVGAESLLEHMSVTTVYGDTYRFSDLKPDAPSVRREPGRVSLRVDVSCLEFEHGVLVIDPFEYQGVRYPGSRVRLRTQSRYEFHFGYLSAEAQPGAAPASFVAVRRDGYVASAL